jgi:phage repressor protein C with HTH and peptisase S24 domain
MTETTFADRLGIALSGEAPGAFSKRARIPDSTVRRYLNGTQPGLDHLVTISAHTNVALAWLAAGQGPMRPAENESTGMPSDFVQVPKLDIRPSAGNGNLAIHDESQSDFMGIREEFLRRLGVSPKNARLMVAKGDSMRGTINDGDLMLVDVSIRQIVTEGIYVLVYNGFLLVKRIQIMARGGIRLVSDNPAYKPEEISMHDLTDIVVEGRVKWSGGAI